jgi:hypothetical protein
VVLSSALCAEILFESVTENRYFGCRQLQEIMPRVPEWLSGLELRAKAKFSQFFPVKLQRFSKKGVGQTRPFEFSERLKEGKTR